jgi:hypothetical protein
MNRGERRNRRTGEPNRFYPVLRAFLRFRFGSGEIPGSKNREGRRGGGGERGKKKEGREILLYYRSVIVSVNIRVV